jgi:hypothetical protein
LPPLLGAAGALLAGVAGAQSALAPLLPEALPGWSRADAASAGDKRIAPLAVGVYHQGSTRIIVALHGAEGAIRLAPRAVASERGTSPYRDARLASVSGFDFLLVPHRLGWIAAGSVGARYSVTVSFLGPATDEHARRAMLDYLAATKLEALARSP